MKRLLTLLILVPMGIIIIALAVANRQIITLSIPPQVGDAPLYSFSIPLFALIFITMFVGMVIGSCATWVKQGRFRKAAREGKVEATKAGFEVQKQKAKIEEMTERDDTEHRAFAALGLPAPNR